MSRSTISVARELRDAESLKIRKTILKASGASSRIEGGVFEQLNASNAQYMEKLENLQKYTKQSKTQLKTNSHLNEWISEQTRLRNLGRTLEDSVNLTLENVLLLSPDMDEVCAVISEMRQSSDDRKARKTFMTSQLREMKELLRMTKRRNPEAAADTNTAAVVVVGGHDAEGNAKKSSSGVHNNSAAAIFASMLLKARTGLSQRWTALCGEEKQLAAALAGCRIKIFSMLREDRMEEQDAALRERFQALIDSGRPLSEQNTASEEEDAQEQELQATLRDWLLKIALLDRRHKEGVSERDGERLQLGAQMALSDPGDPCGGWSESEHDTFKKVYKKGQVTGMARKAMMDTLALQLPKKSREEILRHEEWYRALKLLQHRGKEAEESHLLERERVIATATLELEQLVVAAREQRARAAEAQQLELRREQLHAKLTVLRCHLEEKESSEREARRREEEEQHLRQLEEAATAAMERIEQREKVETFRRQRAAALAEKRRLEQAELDAAQQKLQEMVDANRDKVSERNARILQKEEARRQAQEQKVMEEEMHRLKVLSMLAAEVPYWEAIQNATSKLDHVTASVRAHEYMPLEDDALSLARGHIAMKGFTDQQTIRDSRFRLISALRDAGLQNSAAAHQAVQKLFPRPQLAIHGII